MALAIWIPLIVVSTCSISHVTSKLTSEEVSYAIDEEGPQSALIGSLITDTSLQRSHAPDVLTRLRFNYLSQKPASFAMNLTTGVLRTALRIDRDVMCANAKQCTETFNVGVLLDSRVIQMIKVTITIRDINDNSPRFPESSRSLEIPESSVPGRKFLLPAAVDPDSPTFSIRRYELVSFSNKFQLKIKTKANGLTELHLVTLAMLDRELESTYSLRVIAYDGGVPSKSGAMNVSVIVVDANDNDPVFQQETYRISVFENIDVYTTVLRVQASDRDSGVNGDIVYGLTKYAEMFGINNATGEIYVKGIVDYESAHIYYLGVTATDRARDSRSAEATVIVEVKDVNDHSPEIIVNTPGIPATSIADISEDSEPGTFVAHVKVDDKDSGSNGECNCSLADNKFRLEQLYDGNYQIVTSGELDREKTSTYSLALQCIDGGYNPHVTVKNFQVRLVDINDNAPRFQQATYRANVVENNNVGDVLMVINATDVDVGRNAEVIYSVSEDGRSLFAVDNVSGRITASVVFDREVNSEIHFYVIATDRGVPALSTSALVVITIQDVNDERPIFTQEHYSFNVSENERESTEVGIVIATDADQFPFNEFLFSIVPDSNLMGLFSINSRSGAIKTKGMLDREVQSAFRLVVIASDYGLPIKSSTANVTIQVIDQNDNTPVFIFPEKRNNTVQMSNHSPIGLVVTQVIATDLDDDHNSLLTYRFSSGNDDAFFTIDPNSGVVSVNVEFKDTSYELHEFKVIAQDHGFPQKHAEAVLNIFVNKSIPYPLTAQGSVVTGHNFSIAISLACVSTIIILVLVVAIVMIRRQEREKMQQYNCRMEALRKLANKVTCSNDGKSQKDDIAKQKSKKLPYEIDFTPEKVDEKTQFQNDSQYSKVSDVTRLSASVFTMMP